MAQVHTTIRINGWDKTLKVNAVSLHQSYNQHHTFELLAMPPQNYELTAGWLKSILGEPAEIIIRLAEKGREHIECRFRGFVDLVSPAWTSQGRRLRVQGYSPTIFLDCTARFRTFYKQSLSNIISRVTGAYSSEHLPALTKKGVGTQVHFSVQTQETDYRYLCRLADQAGKLFFYNGEKLFFSELEDASEATLVLELEKDIKQAELSFNLAPLNFRLSGYQLEESRIEQYSCHNQCSSSHSLVKAAVEKSSCYPHSEIYLTHLVNGKEELRDTSLRLLSKQGHELVQLQGVSNHPGLKIGSRIFIKGSRDLVSSGEYLVTQLHHSVSSDSAYRNTFTAVPVGFPFSVRMQADSSVRSGPLMAIVKETNDPEKLGRVRVEFLGDEVKTISPWLRVLTPYTKYGGFFFKPEIGDQVVTFFEDFNAEKMPFIIGAFYHGKATARQWHDPDNKLKGIAMDKIRFLFNDRTGKLEISAEEIEFIARKEMTINAGNHLTQKARRIDLNP